MKIIKTLWYAIVIVYVIAAVTQITAAPDVVFGMGYGAGEDIVAVARQASMDAMQQLGSETADVVILYCLNGEEQDALQGASEVFSPDIIQGGPGKHLAGPAGRDSPVMVLAVGGAVAWQSVTQSMSGSYQSDGRALGKKIKAVSFTEGKGNVAIVLGAFKNPNHEEMLEGIVDEAGKDINIAGLATDRVFNKGQLLEKSAVALVIEGDFDVHFGMQLRKAKEPGLNDYIAAAKKAVERAMDQVGNNDVDMAFIFNCAGRYEQIAKGNLLTDEYQMIKSLLGAQTPFMCIYGLGEIGKETDSGEPLADGLSISIVTLSSHETVSADPRGFQPGLIRTGLDHGDGLTAGKRPLGLDGRRVGHAEKSGSAALMIDGETNIMNHKKYRGNKDHE
jgi:hypothetical protein